VLFRKTEKHQLIDVVSSKVTVTYIQHFSNGLYATKTAVSYNGPIGLKFRPYDIKGIIKHHRPTTEITRFRATWKI